MAILAINGGVPAVSIPRPHDVWPPNAHQDELEELALQRNLDIGIRGRSGPIKEFEEKFLSFLENQVRYAVTFNSGTSALLAAYFAIGIQEDDEVIGPALTYHAALSPVYTLKGNVVLVDVDRNTRCIDASLIETNISKKTKAIVVVHQWGHPANMDEIMHVAKEHNLFLVEDCSHAHGSRYKNKLCGTFGDVAVFSLQTNKAIFAGEGGILVTNNEKIYNRATLLGHYRDRSRDEIIDPDYRKYWVTGFGLKLRMSPFNAIVAKHSLRHFPERKAQRYRCLRYLMEQLSYNVGFIEAPHVSDNCDMGAWYGFKPLYLWEKLDSRIPKPRLIEILRAEGMDVSDPSGPVLSSLPLYAERHDPMFPERKGKVPNFPSQTPVAYDVERRALSFPTFWNWELGKRIIDEYIKALCKVQANVGELF